MKHTEMMTARGHTNTECADFGDCARHNPFLCRTCPAALACGLQSVARLSTLQSKRLAGIRLADERRKEGGRR